MIELKIFILLLLKFSSIYVVCSTIKMSNEITFEAIVKTIVSVHLLNTNLTNRELDWWSSTSRKEWVRWRGCLWCTTLSLCGNESQLLSIQKPAHWLGIRTLIRHTIISPYTTFSNQTGPTHRNQNYTKGKTCLVCMYKDLLPYSRHIAWVLTITMGSSFH